MEDTWLVIVINAMKDLGGRAKYKDIYEKIEEKNKNKLKNNKDWRATVRKEIETHLSDSKSYNGKRDIFYSINGIGKGMWGLRNFEIQEDTLDYTEDDISFPEGKPKLKTHISRERNPRVIEIAKKNFKKKHGKLFCEACGFEFSKKYGKIGEDYIEGHHSIPVSELKENDETKPEDIILLCANCHRMIHRRRPWLKKDELKKLIIDNTVK